MMPEYAELLVLIMGIGLCHAAQQPRVRDMLIFLDEGFPMSD